MYTFIQGERSIFGKSTIHSKDVGFLSPVFGSGEGSTI